MDEHTARWAGERFADQEGNVVYVPLVIGPHNLPETVDAATCPPAAAALCSMAHSQSAQAFRTALVAAKSRSEEEQRILHTAMAHYVRPEVIEEVKRVNAEFSELSDSWADGIWKKGWDAAQKQLEGDKEQIARDKERFEREARERFEREREQIERDKERFEREARERFAHRGSAAAAASARTLGCSAPFPVPADEFNAVRGVAIGTVERAALLVADPQTSFEAVLAVLREPGELQPDQPPSSSPDSSSGAGDQNG